MINIQDLKKRFGKTTVLNGVDLTLGAGDKVALIGSNGAGKTTLIRCILGEYAFSGSLSVTGLDPRKNRVKVLRRVGFVPQLPPPLKMRVGELVKLTARLGGVEPSAIEGVADALGLSVAEHRQQVFAKLSGGMKQKLLIAIALGKAPDVLIMDEPAANLDPEARKAFFHLLSLCNRDTLMLLSSHRIDEISGLVTRMVEMDRGRVVLDEAFAHAASTDRVLACQLTLTVEDPAIAAELTRWGFAVNGSGLDWSGSVAAPDRLRFLGALSRFSGHVADFSWRSGDAS